MTGTNAYAELEARYQGVIDGSVDAIIIIDDTGRIETFNLAAESIFGYRAAEVIGRNVSILMPEPDARRHDGYMHNFLSGGAPKIIGIGREVVGRRKNGETFPMDLGVGEVRGSSRRRFVGNVRDISRRRRLEQALALQEQELRLIFEHAPIGIFTLGFDGRFTRVNPALARLVGYSEPELLAMHCIDLTVPADRARMTQHLSDLVLGVSPTCRCELGVAHRGGAVLAVSLQAVVADNGPQSSFIIGQIVDRTAELRSEQESADARERLAHVGRVTTLGEMASAIAHEINQPLTAISAYAQACKRLFDRRVEEPELIYESLEAIATQALRAGDVVRRIRGFVSHREAGRANADLNEILNSVLALGAIDATSNRVQLTMDFAPDLPPVLVDSVQIQQVCLNLIRNAVDAMQEQPESTRQLAITTRARDGKVEAVFSDKGPGVSPDIRARLFQPFQTTKPEGMGMGLSISQSIIAAHDGLLHYADRPGGGAEFTISLPQASS